MSYNIVSGDVNSFVEGIHFISVKYPYYDEEKLEDNYSHNPYSIQMIETSFENMKELFYEFLEVIIFDILIGNSDRHHSNWGIEYLIKCELMFIKLCPLYDNGSSLCAYVNKNDVESILKDKVRFEALINTKSKSAIGWKDKRPIRHFELLQNLKENYYEETIKYIYLIKNNIDEHTINNILNKFNDNIISPNMKKLLKVYVLERRKRILSIYNLGDEV